MIKNILLVILIVFVQGCGKSPEPSQAQKTDLIAAAKKAEEAIKYRELVNLSVIRSAVLYLAKTMS